MLSDILGVVLDQCYFQEVRFNNVTISVCQLLYIPGIIWSYLRLLQTNSYSLLECTFIFLYSSKNKK